MPHKHKSLPKTDAERFRLLHEMMAEFPIARTLSIARCTGKAVEDLTVSKNDLLSDPLIDRTVQTIIEDSGLDAELLEELVLMMFRCGMLYERFRDHTRADDTSNPAESTPEKKEL